MIDRIRWLFWKRKARQAIREGLTAKCIYCNDHIFPGDSIGVGENEAKERVLVHAGFHYSLTAKDAFCETGAIGIGFWDGKQLVSSGESLASKAARTGQPQIGGC